MVFTFFFKIAGIIFLYLIVNSCASLFTQGFYWREYFGKIPSDAYPGGIDRSGSPIYIGQILHDGRLITTKIYENDPKGYYSLLDKEYSGSDHQKILCTLTPDNFVWVQTDRDKMNSVMNDGPVVGGFEPGYNMYIGRVFYKSETSVGKISAGLNDVLGLYISRDGEEFLFTSFEILTYNYSSYYTNPDDTTSSPTFC